MADPLRLPPDDNELSPYTGWTRAHWERLADHLLEGVQPYASTRGALYALPGPASMSGTRSDGLEGYARTFLLAALRIAGSDGGVPAMTERYRAGLIAGTGDAIAAGDNGNEQWPNLASTPQARVEAALIAIGLYETRPWLWDELSQTEKERVIAWFSGVHGLKHPRNNWLLFPVLINTFLKRAGAPYEQSEIDEHLDRIDAMYRSDGWYTDGQGRNYDHYCGWAIHLYTMLWCRMDGDESDRARAEEYRRRLRRFLQDAQHMFGGDGAPLFQGRSLIYRCAATAAVTAGALAGATPLEPGETRRIASGALRHFVERGAIQDGLLTTGWHDAFPSMAQGYSGPASPYWASKGFLGLLLPPSDPVWTMKEQPLPVEQADFARTAAAPSWLIWGTRSDGIVRVANHGSDHYPFFEGRPDAIYRKLCYSTRAGPELGLRGDEADVDSHVALLDEDGQPTTRARINPIAVADRFAASYYFPKERGEKRRQPPSMWNERIETAVLVRGRVELRIHNIISDRGRGVRDGGWAVAADTPVTTETGANWALARTQGGLTSFIAGVRGFDSAEVRRGEGDNCFGEHSGTPYLLAGADPRAERTFVSIVILTGEPLDPQAVLAELHRIEIAGRLVTGEWADGEALAVQMVAPEDIRIEMAGETIEGRVRYARVSPDGTQYVLREP